MGSTTELEKKYLVRIQVEACRHLRFWKPHHQGKETNHQELTRRKNSNRDRENKGKSIFRQASEAKNPILLRLIPCILIT